MRVFLSALAEVLDEFSRRCLAKEFVVVIMWQRCVALYGGSVAIFFAVRVLNKASKYKLAPFPCLFHLESISIFIIGIEAEKINIKYIIYRKKWDSQTHQEYRPSSSFPFPFCHLWPAWQAYELEILTSSCPRIGTLHDYPLVGFVGRSKPLLNVAKVRPECSDDAEWSLLTGKLFWVNSS